MTTRLDIIIFGATGFTGKHTILEAIKILDTFTWGIAGRSQEKLEAVLQEIGKKADKDLSKIPIILANVEDESSLDRMAGQARVIVNCCGPYRFYGEPVVKACINAGCHHVDVSGEPQYMERMQLEYNDLAAEKGVYIISACGFDSIPADMGTIFLEKHFDGEVNSVETYLETWIKGGPKGGATIHYGTWESAIYGVAHAGELSGIRRKLFKDRLQQGQPKLEARSLIHKTENGNWCLPFPGSDRSVVMRSQRYLFEHEKKRPIQMKAYVAFRSLIALMAVTFMSIIFGLLTRFEFGRNLLLAHPKLFSFGVFSHQGPSDETMRNTKFSITFYGRGWSKEEALAEPTDNHTTAPTKEMTVKVTGSNPGYGATCVAVLLSATTILKESGKMPGKGGVLPPGAAFAKTEIINELCKNGFTFEVISSKETVDTEAIGSGGGDSEPTATISATPTEGN